MSNESLVDDGQVATAPLPKVETRRVSLSAVEQAKPAMPGHPEALKELIGLLDRVKWHSNNVMDFKALSDAYTRFKARNYDLLKRL